MLEIQISSFKWVSKITLPCQRPRPVSFSILSLHIPMYLSGPSENWGVSLPNGDGWSLVENVHDCSCYCYCEV